MTKAIKTIMTGVILLVSSVAFFSCGSGTQPNETLQGAELKGNISISGAFALYPLATKWAEEFQKLHPEVQIDISAGGAGKGMADVLSGVVDMAMFSRGVTPEEVSKGAWYIAVSRDAVLPTVNAKNPVLASLKAKGMNRKQFIDIFITGKITDWGKIVGAGKGIKINVFTRSDACGAAEMWAKYLGSNQETLKGVGVFGDPGIASAVKNDVNAIGFNNLNYAYDIKTRKVYEGIEIIPIDVNEDGKIDSTESVYGTMDNLVKAISDGRYPSPPARDLYFICKGKPKNPIIIAFLKWILNGGQNFIKEAGYVHLPAAQLTEEIKKLN
jgi:phosphate transport system substrate-binding protein